ncbi:MAG: hypothetical protein JSV80_00555 [Acidobacteriota bacterium]|nr:MAG: hypothetical protein JSV80_00555 [Acidobacteriota bacterium]
MGVRLDEKTIQRLRAMKPENAYQAAKNAVYATGECGSEDFLDLYEQLVEREILTWEQIDALEGRPTR